MCTCMRRRRYTPPGRVFAPMLLAALVGLNGPYQALPYLWPGRAVSLFVDGAPAHPGRLPQGDLEEAEWEPVAAVRLRWEWRLPAGGATPQLWL